jgi:hypothetical protein
MAKTMTTMELVAGVRQHARANVHDGGWALVIDHWTDTDLVMLVAGTDTVTQAIDAVRRWVQPLAPAAVTGPVAFRDVEAA